MFCGMCGKQVGPNIKFCPHCGAAVAPTQQAPAAPANPPKKKKSRAGWMILGVVLAAILLTVGFLLIRKALQKPSEKKPVLTMEDAQELLDEVLEEVYDSADPDNDIAKVLEDGVRAEILSLEPSDDGYRAECEVTAPDLFTLLSEYILSLETAPPATYSEVIAGLQAKLQKADSMHESFRVEFVEMNDVYRLILPEDMIVFCSGNIQQLLPALNERFQGGDAS